mmetsp:Transcript_61668/g.72055  ORF Transcript_61668/g.72055 Transcript_61668/m.72055 type:complete len:96 (-) Transcript_61668:79-366(-)
MMKILVIGDICIAHIPMVSMKVITEQERAHFWFATTVLSAEYSEASIHDPITIKEHIRNATHWVKRGDCEVSSIVIASLFEASSEFMRQYYQQHG